MKHLIPEFARLRQRYPDGFASSLVLPCLRRIQEERGYVADEDIDGLIEYLDVPRIQIEEVLSFYTQFRRAASTTRCDRPRCGNARWARGGERLLKHLEDTLGIAAGETTPDGRFTLSTAECMASCGTAPMIVIDGKFHEDMTPEKFDAWLATQR